MIVGSATVGYLVNNLNDKKQYSIYYACVGDKTKGTSCKGRRESFAKRTVAGSQPPGRTFRCAKRKLASILTVASRSSAMAA